MYLDLEKWKEGKQTTSKKKKKIQQKGQSQVWLSARDVRMGWTRDIFEDIMTGNVS